MVISKCCSLFLFLLLFVCLFFCRGLHGILSPKWSAAREVQLFVLARAIKFLVISVVVAVPVVDADAHYYHICHITVHMLK